ncbi:MAG: transcriptional regulator, partial [candidate division Zixibacteria bacterium]|nr:transcriptional regulator [candidate division Zixibacteria bacterium]
MIFGAKDKLPREIVGSNYRNDRASLESLKHEVAVQTNGISFQEIYELDLPEGRVVMFQIPAAPAGIPTSWKGHFYGRDGESLGALSVQELDTIRNQATEVDWSAVVCENATVDDLDEQAIQIAREKFSAKHKASEFKDEIGSWDTATFLDKTKITRNGQITKTAILLLGKPESAHHMNPHPAQLSWKLEAEEEAYEHFGPPFLLSVEGVFKRIRNIKFKLQPFNQLVPIELTKYDSKIILEALNNCIAHQDYSQNA